MASKNDGYLETENDDNGKSLGVCGQNEEFKAAQTQLDRDLFERPKSCPPTLHCKQPLSRQLSSTRSYHRTRRRHGFPNETFENTTINLPPIITVNDNNTLTVFPEGKFYRDDDLKSQLSAKSNLSTRSSFSIKTQLSIALRPEPLESPSATTLENNNFENLFPRRLVVFMLALLCSTNLCLAMGASLIAPFFPEQAIHKGGSATWAGVVMSSFDAVRFFLAPVVGQYISVIGARFMLISGPFIVAWCSVLFGVLGMAPPGMWFFILGCATRMVAGCGAIAYSVTSVSIRPVLFCGNVSFAYGALRASSTLDVIIGPAVGGILYAAGGYGLPFWVLGALSLTLTCIQAFVTPDLSDVDEKKRTATEAKTDDKAVKTSPPEIKINDKHFDGNSQDSPAVQFEAPKPTYKTPSVYAFSKNFHILLCFIMNASIGYVVMFYSANISLHVLPLVHNDVSKVGYIILISGIAEVIIAPLAGWLLDRGMSAQLSIIMSYTLCAIGLLLIGPSPLLPFLSKSLTLVIIGTFVYGCGIGFGFSAPYKLATHEALARGYPPNQQTYGVLAGCMVTFYTFGAFLGPITGGLLHDTVGFRWAATIVCGYLLVMIGITTVRTCLYRSASKKLEPKE